MNLLGSALFWNAFIGGTVIAAVAAAIGYFVVMRAQVFASEALKDIGFVGATGAALIGLDSIAGMLALSLLAALTVGSLSERVRGRDVEVGMILSFALGLGVLFLSLYAHSSASHASSGVNILFGSMLSITRSDLVIAIVGGAFVLVALALLSRPLLFSSIDPTVAAARGLPVRWLSMAFMILLGITTATSVLVVGVLLVVALLIAPAAAAINLVSSPPRAILTAMAIAVGATWAGLALALLPGIGHLPIAFTISAVTALAYLSSVALRRRDSARPPLVPEHPSRETGAPDHGQPV